MIGYIILPADHPQRPGRSRRTIGFGLALVLFAGIREQLALLRVPKGMQGMPIALLSAGLLALAFMGFSGIVKL